MKEHHYTCTLIEVNVDEISESERQLITKAEEALKSAYAPYSEFKVGAAILLQSGKIVLGSNQENAAYPSGLCAERVALFSAASQFKDERIIAMAVTTSKETDEPIAPCGACRQVMIEYEVKQNDAIKLLLSNASKKIYISQSVENILPMIFKLEK
ncbi:MAG: cytidine deaminase [Fimbriimonadaceae bacterium]|nr:cytidine deaminase [Chitinophagales bacterium]